MTTFSNCYKIAQHARYEINNTASLRSSAPNIVDLPSGYSPRGFRVSSAGKRYFGFDLPVVIDDMAPAAHKVMTPQQRSLSSYHAVDATNYHSMTEGKSRDVSIASRQRNCLKSSRRRRLRPIQ